MACHWHQLLSKFNGKICEALFGLVEFSGNGVVLHVELSDHARALLISVGGNALSFHHLVDVASQRRQHTHGPRAVHFQFVKLSGEHAHIAQFVHMLEPLHESLVHVCLDELGELLHLHSCHLSEAGRILVHLCDELTHHRARRGHLLVVLVKRSSETHNLRLCQMGLLAHTAQLLSKFHDGLRLCR